MGAMNPLAPMTDAGRLVVTPHPVLLDGQRNLECDLRPGESLYTFLSRHVDLTQRWEVCIGGVVVPVEHWVGTYPVHGQVIECRAAVGKSVLRIVALVALTYFTFGIGTAGGFIASTYGAFAATGVYIAGSMLINRVLAPKPMGLGSLAKEQDPTFALSSQRNAFRAHEPPPLLFGKCKVTPDLTTDQPYTFFRGDDQYLALTLNLGIGVDRVDDLYNGEALLSSFSGVEVYHTGFPGMTDDGLPLYSNTDTVVGGSLDSPVGTYVQRTSADDAVRGELDFEYNIYNYDSKGKPKYNTEGVTIQWRLVGSPTWDYSYTTSLSGSKPKIQRFSIGFNLAQGQYQFQAKRNGTSSTDSDAHCEVNWTSLRAVQNDTGNYKGLSRIGVVCKATGQLNGALDELRCVAYAEAIEGWNGSAWVTSADFISNPGAQILKYARGWYDEDGVLIAGMGRPDSRIDLESIKGFIAHCAANGYTYDYYLKEARSHDDVLNTIALAGFGQISRAGGKLSVVWAADEQPLSGVVNMATIKRGQFQVDYTLAGAADGIEFTYLDQSDWTNKTLRVSAPGVTTPLNPARVAGEGITSETHAAEMARYHLAQSLYQYKTITFGTDLEHLSYGRMSKLALQHDLTQWGYGGRVQSVDVDGFGVVTVGLDEPVPAGGAPYIGLRVPGEAVYRVFEVEPPAEETRTIVLVDGWPVDLPDVPGDSDANPAHDTIWIYDFKSDPGYAVRVVGIEPENGMKGASVTCVPESAEFWTYVKTGDYEPPVASTLPSVRPVASNVQVAEATIVQGDTTYTELNVAFDLAGTMDHALVFAQYTNTSDETTGELLQVASTFTREASFRIYGAGTYLIVVRPYSADGVVGGAAQVEYDTVSTQITPPNFENFVITEEDGGLRQYQWWYSGNSPPDLAGIEIRYTAETLSPVWESMTPLGTDGFHAQVFESTLPPAGDWTFAWKARTTAGLLSIMSATSQTLGDNLGEVLTGVQGDVTTAQGNIAALQTQADDLQAQVDAIEATSVAPALGAADYDNATAYAADDYVLLAGVIYKAKGATTGHSPPNATYWDVVGSVASTLDAQAGQLTDHETRITTAEGSLTSLATSVTAVQADITDIEADVSTNAGALSSLSGTVSTLSGTVSSQGAAITAAQADITDLQGDVSTNAGAISSLSGTVTTQGAAITANASAITAANAAITGKADASAVTALEAKVSQDPDNFVRKSNFDDSTVGGWGDTGYTPTTGSDGYAGVARWMLITHDAWELGNQFPCAAGDVFNTSWLTYCGSSGQMQFGLSFYNTAGSLISSLVGSTASASSGYSTTTGSITAPANAVKAAPYINWASGTAQVADLRIQRVSSAEAAMYAKWTVSLDVNGYVTGVESFNDGTTGTFTVVADVFKVIDPDGGDSLQWDSGVLTALSGSNSLKLGAGFGSDTDKLIFAYGADGSSSTRTFASAKVAITAAGKAKLAGTGTNYASGWSGAAITSSYSSASPAVVTINVASGTFVSLGSSISYSSSSNTTSQTRGTTVRYYLYYSDSALSGGSKTLNISTDISVSYSNTDYVFLGFVDVTVPASGSGSGGGGSPPCVSVDAWVIRNGKRSRAGEVQVGDVLALFDPITGASEGLVTYSVPALTDMVRIVTESGHTLACSTAAPIPVERGGFVLAPDLMGHRVLVAVDGRTRWETVADIVRLPRGWVQHITVGDRCFWAGDADAYLLHHNVKAGP